jgi:hypothetical protein
MIGHLDDSTFLIAAHLVDQKQLKKMEMKGLTSFHLHQDIYMSVSCGS